ncbi:MAG: hypothetical protein Ct9H300mP27_09490 [Chloroflexota bacterium]|nr:MAG: hypothetical protein Ct9H300mP27_09490 [Chloroflexota bacterium]
MGTRRCRQSPQNLHSRSRALRRGYNQIFPEEESSFLTAKQARAKLAVFYGGRVAEELIFKEITTGACSDISRATELAQYMIMSGGMSEVSGHVPLESAKKGFFPRT